MQTIMPTDTTPSHPANAWFWTGWIISGLVMLFLVFDGVTKILKVTPVLEACEKLGISSSTVPGIGLLLLACTVIYAIPRTSVLGAILLTAFLGGAVAIHVRGGSGAFPVAFAVAFGLLAWLGLALRDPQLLRSILLRR